MSRRSSWPSSSRPRRTRLDPLYVSIDSRSLARRWRLAASGLGSARLGVACGLDSSPSRTAATVPHAVHLSIEQCHDRTASILRVRIPSAPKTREMENLASHVLAILDARAAYDCLQNKCAVKRHLQNKCAVERVLGGAAQAAGQEATSILCCRVQHRREQKRIVQHRREQKESWTPARATAPAWRRPSRC